MRAMAMTTQITSREFNQDASGAKRAAQHGPVFITDRGRPAHVLLTFADYEELIGVHRVLDLLGQPNGVDEVEFTAPTSRDLPRPASFD